MAHDAWAVELDGSIVGFTSLRPIDGDRELTIAVRERCWGRGVAFKAARAAMYHGPKYRATTYEARRPSA